MEQKTEILKGKKIVIIGGTAGIGLATAKAAALKDAQVIIVSSNPDRLNEALKSLPGNAKGMTVNVNDEQQVKHLFEQTGNFDHLVYTAGENPQLSPIADTTVADAKQFFNIRYWGAFTAVKYAVPFISKSGSIVLTGGISAIRPNKGWSLGASICSAMEGFTRAMAIELAPVRVNIVSPGIVKTDFWGFVPEAGRESFYTQRANSLPVQRVAEPADIAQTYIYLMEQAYGTGQRVVVDGGSVLV